MLVIKEELKKMYKIIALCGKSGAGKDSLMMATFSHLEEYLNPIISHTTRPKREKEIADKNYHFVSDDQFLTLIDENKMLEITSFNNWYYGTSIDSLSDSKVNIGVFNPEGIISLLKDDRIELEIYYITAKGKTRLIRQLNREKNPDVNEIIRRYTTDEIQFQLMNNIKCNIVVNETLEDYNNIVNLLTQKVKQWAEMDQDK